MIAAIGCGFTTNLTHAQSTDSLTAAERGDLQIVNALLKAGAGANEKHTMLVEAAANGHLDVVQVLLAAKVDVNDTKNGALGPTTALMEAASNGHLTSVPVLIAANADVNATRGRKTSTIQTGDGVTALALASRNGHMNVVQALLAANADVNAGSMPALYHAVAAGNLEIVKVLLTAKPNLNWQDPNLGSTILMLALAPSKSVLLPDQLPLSGRWDIAQLLIEAGADVNVMTKAGVTALMMVVQENSPRSLAMVQALLAAHADINGGCVCSGNMVPIGSVRHANAVGHTALGLAAETGSIEVVQALLDANEQRAANPLVAVNAKQRGGTTALMVAATKGRSDVVRLLLAAKADVRAVDDSGKTAEMLALENGHTAVAELLRSAAGVPGQR